MPSLTGAFRRIDRADQHLNELRRAIEEYWIDPRNEYDYRLEGEPPRVIVVPPVDPAPLPQLLSILVGETIYNLRSALDYLVYELAWLDTGLPQPGTQFPIDEKEATFARRTNGFLKGLSALHRFKIEAYQPYSGCRWTRRLRVLSNPDKHQMLTTVGEELRPVAFITDPYPRPHAPGGPYVLAVGGKVFPAYGNPPRDVHVDVGLLSHIAFADKSGVEDELGKLASEARSALEDFREEFS